MARPNSPPFDTLRPALEAGLRTQRFGREMQCLASVNSTNTRAQDWAASGAPEGSMVLTEAQTAGRGRLGRTWDAAPGLNLLFSIILRPSLPPDQFGLITLAAAVAVSDAVSYAVAPSQASIKWPNDILIDGRKCCGILLESSISAVGSSTVILGIGLNVNQTVMPDHLSDHATSLFLESGRPIDRAALLADLLLRLEARYDSLMEDGGTMVRTSYLNRVEHLGQQLHLRQTVDGTPVQGRFVGITATGALQLQTADVLHTFHAGEITSHLEF